MSPSSRDRAVRGCSGSPDTSVGTGWNGQPPAQGCGELAGVPSAIAVPRDCAAGSRRPA